MPTVQGDENLDFIPNQYTQIIWNWFKSNTSFTEEGIASLMGNMYAESTCTPYACQPNRAKNICEIYIENVDNDRITRYQFAHGGCSSTGDYTSIQLGFGLCQWTLVERKEAFHKYFFQNYPTMSGTIGDIYKQMEYAVLELTGSASERDPYGILNYNPVGTVLKTSHSINDCSDIVLEIYENPTDQSQAVHELRRKLSQQVLDEYGGGGTTLHIYTIVQGNGTIYVSNPTPVFEEIIHLVCTPVTGESFIEVIGTTLGGQSVALDPYIADQYFQMPNESVTILAEFTGTTPPVPVPTVGQRHRMPIWMYPNLRRI